MMLLHVHYLKKIEADIASGLFVNLIIKAQVQPIVLWDTVSFMCVLHSLKNAVGHLGIPYMRKIHILHIVYTLRTAFHK